MSVEAPPSNFEKLTDPYLITLHIANRSRFDINSGDFDSGAPIRFDLGAKIVDVMKVSSDPETRVTPRVTVAKNQVEVGPSLIRRGQRIAITVLTEGPVERRFVESPLIDVGARLQPGLRLQETATPSLTERANLVSEALRNVRQLFADLEAEVQARSAVVERLTGEAYQAEVRAEEAMKRAALNEEQAKAVDAWLDRALQSRLGEMERASRRREWLLGTIVTSIIGLAVGVAAILIAHFWLGFLSSK